MKPGRCLSFSKTCYTHRYLLKKQQVAPNARLTGWLHVIRLHRFKATSSPEAMNRLNQEPFGGLKENVCMMGSILDGG